MKIRMDYVTNSSSSSYIICFARIKDEEKANKIIEKHGLNVFDVEGVKNEMRWTGELGADWCGAVIWDANKIIEKYPDDKFVIIDECLDAYYEEDEDGYYDTVYDYDFTVNDAINEITEENGFTDIDVQEGEGRNG